MIANYQASSFPGVGVEWGDSLTHTGCQAFLNRSLYKISRLLLRFAWKDKKRIKFDVGMASTI